MYKSTVALAILLSLLVASICSAQIAPDQQIIDGVAAGTIQEAKASAWGFDPEDSTAQLQAAIDSGVPKLIVDKMAGPWIVTPLTLVSDQDILFEEGVELLAKRGEYLSKNATLVTASNKENVTLTGYGATFRMWQEDYDDPAKYDRAEWRHCLSIRSSSNIEVYGLTLTESGGDGIYLGTATAGVTNKDIIIKDVVCDKNYRQGISVITAENLLIESCTLTNTGGTAPMAGIDFEPNKPGERVVNCVMRDCIIGGNSGNGIVMYLRPLDATSVDISLRFENCVCTGDRGAARVTLNEGAAGAPDGLVEFVDCVFQDAYGSGIQVSKPADRSRVRFVNCSVINPAAEAVAIAPIMLLSRQGAVSPVGGVEFVDCVVSDTLDRNPIKYVNAGDVGIEDVTGTLIIEKDGQRETVALTEEVLAEWMPVMEWKDIPHLDLEGVALQALNADVPADACNFGQARVRRTGAFLLSATEGDQVSFTVHYFQVGKYGGKPVPVVLTTPSGAELRPGEAVFLENTEISFTAPETGVYDLVADPGANRLRITQSTNPINLDGRGGTVGLIGSAGDYYFWVPAGTREFGARVCGEGAGESVAAKLINPAGEIVEEVDNCFETYQFEVELPEGTEGQVWLLKIQKPSAMPWEDHYMDLRGVPPILSPTPEALIIPAQ